MSRLHANRLGRREAQIMECVYRLRRGTVADIRSEHDEQPSYSSVRKMLEVLERKGFVRHQQDGARYVYMPATPVRRAAREALQGLVQTFFEGSVEDAAATLLTLSDRRIKPEDLERI